MSILFTFTRSIYVLLAFVCNDLLLFDWWIITPPGSAPAPRRNPDLTWRFRALAALRTACTYAVVEPLWFRLLNGASANFVVGYAGLTSQLYIQALQTAESLMLLYVFHAVQKQQQQQQQHQPSRAIFEDCKGGLEHQATKHSDIQGVASPALPGEAGNYASAQPLYWYGRRSVAKLALLLPAATAAAVNVAILQCAAYLHTDESRELFESFPKSWCFCALTVPLALANAKWNNLTVHRICNRHVLIMDPRWMLDLATRVSAWAILIAIRSAYRFSQARPSFSVVLWGEDGLTLSTSSLLGIRVSPVFTPDPYSAVSTIVVSSFMIVQAAFMFWLAWKLRAINVFATQVSSQQVDKSPSKQQDAD